MLSLTETSFQDKIKVQKRITERMFFVERFIALVVCFAMVLPFLCAVPVMAEQKPITVILNGAPLEFDVPPVIINSRTMVPMRAIFEALGAKVNWNGFNEAV